MQVGHGYPLAEPGQDGLAPGELVAVAAHGARGVELVHEFALGILAEGVQVDAGLAVGPLLGDLLKAVTHAVELGKPGGKVQQLRAAAGDEAHGVAILGHGEHALPPAAFHADKGDLIGLAAALGVLENPGAGRVLARALADHLGLAPALAVGAGRA